MQAPLPQEGGGRRQKGKQIQPKAATTCHVVSCRVMSCHVVSCHVVSCRVMSCHVVLCRVMSCHVVSCRVMSCRVVPCRVMSRHVNPLDRTKPRKLEETEPNPVQKLKPAIETIILRTVTRITSPKENSNVNRLKHRKPQVTKSFTPFQMILDGWSCSLLLVVP